MQRRANRRHDGQGPMDQRIESFAADALALAGEEPEAVPDLNMIYRGSTRTVVTFGLLAFEFGRGKNGMRCNRHEADLYRRSSARRRSMLCPVCCGAPAPDSFR